MQHCDKSKAELIQEIQALQQQNARLEQAECRLQQRMRELEIITANLPNIIWKADIDDQGRFLNTYISEAADELLGLPPQTIGHNWETYFSYIKPGYLPAIQEKFRLAVEHPGVAISFEYEVYTARQEIRWFASTGRVYFEDGARKVYGFTVDITQRKEAEQALKESEERFRTIFEMALDMVCIADIETATFLQVNPAFTAILGYTREELLERPFLDFIHPDDVASTIAVVENELRRGSQVIHFINRYRHKDGTYRWLDWTSHPNPKHGITYAIAHDITEHKNAEKALKESEKRYRTLVETIPYGIAEIDTQGVYQFTNHANYEILGYEEPELPGKTIFEMIPDSERQAFRQMFQRIIRERPLPATRENKNVRKNGDVIDVQVDWNYKFDSAGELVGFITVITDITERKHAEQALKESEERLRLILENTKDIIFMQDPQGRYLYYNGPAMYGLTPEKVLGKTPYDFFDDETASAMIATLQQVIVTGERFEKETRVTWKGQSLWFLDEVNPVCDAAGQVIAVSQLSRNITELKTVERKLREADAAKNTFFSIIAHDLKNPFIGFMSGTELLEKRLQQAQDKVLWDVAHELHCSAQHLHRLLENLLTWARMQQGRIPYTPEPLEVAELIHSCCYVLRDSAERKQLRLNCSIPQGMTVYADSNMLHSIFRNLLSNALKFTPEGGEVTISARSRDHDVEITVTDTGVGMDADMLQRLFIVGEKRLSSPGISGEQGTGLGLVLCREFVERQGGVIWAQSEKGRGSIFHFTLPKPEAVKHNGA